MSGPPTAETTLTTFFDDRAAEGLCRLADAMKAFVHARDPFIFALLDFQDDRPFLDPLVFSTAAGKQTRGLRQILFAYIPPERRAQVGSISVRTDSRGTVYLPNFGILCCDAANEDLLLEWDSRTNSPVLLAGSGVLPHRVEELLFLPGSAIEICQDSSLDLLFSDEDFEVVPVDLRTSAQNRCDDLGSAVEMVREHCPYYAGIIAVTKRVALFAHNGLNSFASMAAHGTAFLNVSHGVDEVLFIEDLVHQSGHILFSTATIDRSGLFSTSEDTTLSEILGAGGDRRSVYVALHGLVTEAMMCETLTNCYSNDVFTGRQQHELLGRLAYAAIRFGMDLELLKAAGVFGPVGEELYDALLSSFWVLRDQYGPLLRRLDLHGQPYNFSYDRFAARNQFCYVDDIAQPRRKVSAEPQHVGS
ncbi:MAG TPA: hypothetical protein VHT75_02980 [Acidimicrobiales bacterium]|jgi:hypothetical protein|nr:hypothetical protein [Acidimicrobiales bacterium]